jgi:hypothetical protein
MPRRRFGKEVHDAATTGSSRRRGMLIIALVVYSRSGRFEEIAVEHGGNTTGTSHITRHTRTRCVLVVDVRDGLDSSIIQDSTCRNVHAGHPPTRPERVAVPPFVAPCDFRYPCPLLAAA